MKKILFLIAMLIFIISCKSNSQNYEFEDKLYKCLVEESQKEGIILNEKFKEIENIFKHLSKINCIFTYPQTADCLNFAQVRKQQ